MRFAPSLAVIAAIGCNPATESAAPEPVTTSTSGALTVNWTINGAADPNQCQSAAADAIQITISRSATERVGSFEQSCNAFATSITLDAGIYVAEAILIDAAGAPRTQRVLIDRITINGKSEFITAIDFAPIVR
jgi:hypothetical protein